MPGANIRCANEQTTDVEGEVNGLMTYDRKFIKVDPAALREMNAPLTGGK
jgi:hypothetical protein